MSRALADAALAALRTTGVSVHDSYVEIDESTKVITWPLPFLVFYSNLGDEFGEERLDGRSSRRNVDIEVAYIGETRDQALLAGEKARAVLSGARLAVTGRRAWLCNLERSDRVNRADDAVRTGGLPLFVGRDYYTASVTTVRPVT